jgi:hypothetical protein
MPCRFEGAESLHGRGWLTCVRNQDRSQMWCGYGVRLSCPTLMKSFTRVL